MSWFQPTFLRRTARLGLAPWRYLHIRLHSMYYLFIAIIPCIPEYKHSASFPVPWHNNSYPAWDLVAPES